MVHFTLTGPAPSRPTTVDERDLIDVTDPVQRIVAQAMASMHLNLHHDKPKQCDLPDAKECVKQVMGVMSDLPEVPDVISTSKLKKNVMKTGNISFFCHVM